MSQSYQKDLHINKKTVLVYRFFILLSILECLIAFLLILNKYQEEMRILFWNRAEFLVLFFLFILPLLLLSFLFAESYITRTLINKIHQKISQATNNIVYGILLTGLILVGLGIELLVLFPTTKYLQFEGQNQLIFKIFSPNLVVAILFFIQVIAFLTYIRNPDWEKLWSDIKLRNMIFGFIILGFTLFYWEILFIQSEIFLSIPYWFRPVMKQPFTRKHLYFVPFLILIFWGVKVVFSKSVSIVNGMILLIIFGYCLQFMFGLVAGEGFESIRKSYSERPISHTVVYGCSDMSIRQSVLYYEGHYADSYRVQTKPPGYVVGHKIIAKFTNFLSNSQSFDECVFNYSRIGAYIFPFLATLVIIPITYLSKNLFRLRHPLLPGLLYILTPNFMIWVMVVDQVFFPLMFLVNIGIMYLTVKKESFFLAVGLGLAIYLSAFITFAMLPAIGLYCFWLAAIFITSKNKKVIFSLFKLLLGFIVGFGLAHIFFYIFLNYDIAHRYQMASSFHRLIKGYDVNLRTIRNAFINNSVEYFIWTGIPLLLLVTSAGISSIYTIIHKKHESKDLFTLSFIGMYVALNILSNTHGEVQRMWIFLSPLVVILSAGEIQKRIKNDSRLAIVFLLFIQFCTAVWNFQFIRNQYQ